MSLSVTQNNCWLVAESKKKIQGSIQKYRTTSELQNEIKKIIVVLKSKKLFLFEKNDKKCSI